MLPFVVTCMNLEIVILSELSDREGQISCGNIYIFIYYIFIYFSVNEHLICFHVLVTNTATMNSGAHLSLQIVVYSGYMPSTEIAES